MEEQKVLDKEMELRSEQPKEHKQEDVHTYNRKYHVVEYSKSINILLIGKTTTGKSTIVQTLKNPSKVPPPRRLFSRTIDPELFQFNVYDSKGGLWNLNIIDSPGLFEAREKIDNIRNNEIIMDTIIKFLDENIFDINVVGIVHGGISILDIDLKAFDIVIGYLGNELSSNAALIITGCEAKSDEELQILKKEFEEGEKLKTIRDYCKLGIIFTGAIDPNYASVFPDIVPQLTQRVERFVDDFLDRILALPGKGLPLDVVSYKQQQVEAQHQQLLEYLGNKIKKEELDKPGCSLC